MIPCTTRRPCDLPFRTDTENRVDVAWKLDQRGRLRTSQLRLGALGQFSYQRYGLPRYDRAGVPLLANEDESFSMSSLTWLDSSEQERRSVLELVSALNEPGTLDELGIGTIRDTIADKLFRGTMPPSRGLATSSSFRGSCSWSRMVLFAVPRTEPAGSRCKSVVMTGLGLQWQTGTVPKPKKELRWAGQGSRGLVP